MDELAVVAAVEVGAPHAAKGKEGVAGKEHAVGSIVEADAALRVARGMDASQLGLPEADDVAVGQQLSYGRWRARIGYAEGTHLVGIVFGPPAVAPVSLARQAPLRLGKGNAEDMVEVEVGAEDVAHRQPLAVHKPCQLLLLSRAVAAGVDDRRLARVVPHHIGVRRQHIELKNLQSHPNSLFC